jgi:ATP-binding cassette subfamily B protein
MIFHGGGHGFFWGLGRELDQKPVISRKALLRIGGYLLPYWREWALILVCITISAVLGLVPPLLVKALLDQALPERDGGLLNLLVLGMVAAPLLAGLVGVWQSWLNSQIGHGVMFDLRNHLYRRLQSQSLRFFTHTKTGDIMSRVLDDVSGVQGVVTSTLVGIVTNVVTLVSTLVLIFSLDWRLSVLALLVIPAFILPTRQVGRMRHRLSKEVAEQNARVTAHLSETLSVSGALLVKAFARERREIEQFRQKSAALRDLEVRRGMVGRWFFMFLGLFGSIGPALVYLVGGWLVIGGQLTVGTIVAFVTLLGRLYGPAAALANVHVEVMSSMALFNRIFEYLDLEPEIRDAPNARPLPPVAGRIEFRNVTFAYVPGRPALEEVSFVAEPGQLVALVGPSGAGKTTVTYLVPRFYDASAGAVLIDGHDVRTVTLESLRAQIGMVTQETFLFHASIRENLLYARPEATPEEIEAACRAAYIHDFILALPNGYDTVVGERGYRLSGGEKQRLAIARVLLKDPRILLLDEATSSLDSRSEALIQAALEPLLRGRTSLVIAHRLSTILSADKILVFDQGRLVEQGTHAELLARGGLYARLYEQQFRSDRTRGAPLGDDGREPGAPAEDDRAPAAPARHRPARPGDVRRLGPVPTVRFIDLP